MTCLVSTAAVAESGQIGHKTQQWLDLQKSGEQAATDKRPLSGDVAGRVYLRYLKSFESEVPEQFDAGMDIKHK